MRSVAAPIAAARCSVCLGTCLEILEFLCELVDFKGGGGDGGRGRSRTHQARIRTSTALKAARPTGDDALPLRIITIFTTSARAEVCGGCLGVG